jgi:translation initiation factor 2 alpha subunit (eIF-2alpha)
MKNNFIRVVWYNDATQWLLSVADKMTIRIDKITQLMCFAFRVDKDKGYIDLSKRRVSPEDIERCTEIFSKAKVG